MGVWLAKHEESFESKYMIHYTMHCRPIHKIAHHDPPPHPQSPTVMKYTNFSVLSALFSTSMVNAACTTTNSVNTDCTSLTDANFQTAVDLWISDPTQAEADYGHIKDW